MVKNEVKKNDAGLKNGCFTGQLEVWFNDRLNVNDCLLPKVYSSQ